MEGDEDTIRALMARIENDQRHTNVTIRRARPETD
ncbi:BLUF domain-containing protein [Mycobacterium tuberculosis]